MVCCTQALCSRSNTLGPIEMFCQHKLSEGRYSETQIALVLSNIRRKGTQNDHDQSINVPVMVYNALNMLVSQPHVGFEDLLS